MKTFVAMFLALFTVISAKAEPQSHRGYTQHSSSFRPHVGGLHFVARSGNDFHPHFHYGKGGVLIFDPFACGNYSNFSGDDAVYQGQVAPQDSLPYATLTSDPDLVISPYEPHATIGVVGIPHGAEVQDPVSNLIFLNP